MKYYKKKNKKRIFNNRNHKRAKMRWKKRYGRMKPSNRL